MPISLDPSADIAMQSQLLLGAEVGVQVWPNDNRAITNKAITSRRFKAVFNVVYARDQALPPEHDAGCNDDIPFSSIVQRGRGSLQAHVNTATGAQDSDPAASG